METTTEFAQELEIVLFLGIILSIAIAVGIIALITIIVIVSDALYEKEITEKEVAIFFLILSLILYILFGP